MMEADKTSQFFENEGHLTGEGVSLYVDALKMARTEDLPPAVPEHVQGCQQCKEEVTGLFALLSREDYSTVGRHPYFDREAIATERTRFRVLKIAASIVAVVGVGGLAYVSIIHMSTEEQRPESIAISPRVDTTHTVSPDSVTERRPPRDQALLAARFVESPELEDLLRNPARSSTTEVFSPANGASVRRNSLFRWETPAQPPFEIAILDNQRQTIRSFQTDTSEFVLQDSLQKGLYYWKLGGEGSLLHVGKFVVR